MTSESFRRSTRSGISLIELLAVLAVAGVLISLTLPAIHAVRESARRSECQSNLRQIGLAILAYESVHQMLPPGNMNYGVHTRLLPWLDRPDLDAKIVDGDATALRQSPVAVYRCPSDPAPERFPDPPVSSGAAATSYAGNSGTGVQNDGFNGLFQHWIEISPAYPGSGPVRVTDVTDGLSQTAAFAEILHADGTFQQLRVLWNTPGTLPQPHFARLCQQVPVNAHSHGWNGAAWDRGVPWIVGDQGVTFYNHVLTPNLPSCMNGTEWQTGAYTAASMHAGGVNVLFGDGHVQFVSESVSPALWRDFGSRDSSR